MRAALKKWWQLLQEEMKVGGEIEATEGGEVLADAAELPAAVRSVLEYTIDMPETDVPADAVELLQHKNIDAHPFLDACLGHCTGSWSDRQEKKV